MMVRHPSEIAPDGTLVWAGYQAGFGENRGDISNSGAYFEQPLRLPGQYFDEETGLHYNLFRYYAPNPLGWIDPLGLSCIKWNDKAQRFQGANGRFISRAEAAKTIRINPQKQAGHIQGTPQYNNRLKQGKPTSAFDGQADVDKLVRDTLEHGSPVPNQPGKFDLETGSSVGTGPNGGPQTKVRVHVDSKGEAHGHPAGREL